MQTKEIEAAVTKFVLLTAAANRVIITSYSRRPDGLHKRKLKRSGTKKSALFFFETLLGLGTQSGQFCCIIAQEVARATF